VCSVTKIPDHQEHLKALWCQSHYKFMFVFSLWDQTKSGL
jgi:hypothetical protein